MRREFLIPLLLGVLVAIALGFLTAPDPPAPEPEVRMDAVFPVAYVPENRTAAVLLVERGTRPDNVTVMDANGTRTQDLTWGKSRVALVPIRGAGLVLDREQVLVDARVEKGAGLFDGGTDRIKATIYVFDETGLLVATNAPLHERNRFEVSGDFAEIGDPWWYMGEGKAPNGTAELPFFGPRIRQEMAGLPVGGVTAAYVPDHPYAWAVGPVHITARIEAIA